MRPDSDERGGGGGYHQLEVSVPTGKAPRPATPAGEVKAKKRDRRELARSGALLVLAVVVIVFAVENLKDVRVKWIFGSGQAPLIVVIVISLLVGIVLTHLAGRLSRRRR